MTVLKKCFAIDYSGSTWNDSFYHSNVRSILDTKFCEGDEIIIWDNSAKYISKSEYMEINRTRDGNGGTYPKCIFNAIFKKYTDVHYTEFILISDGEICDSEVESLDSTIQQSINKFHCDYCEVYLLGNGANLSVACPFTRFNASRTIVKKPCGEDQIISISDEDLNTIKEIDTINTEEEFNLKFDALERAFVARLLGTNGDQELRKSVLLMHKRINANNSMKDENKNDRINELVMIDKDYETAQEEVIKCFGSVLGGDFQSRINQLIRMCDGGLKQLFDINKLQTFRQYTASDTEVNEVDDIQNLDIETSVENSEWTCPISYDNEVDPMILITADHTNFQPVLIGFDKLTTERILNCPLNALYNDEFITKFKSCIDHTISLKNYRDSFNTSNPIRTSPFTRKTIIGAIPLGENDEHVNAANWSLMKIITGGKDLGDKNLWFFMLYRMIQKGLFPYLNDIEPYMKAQVQYRFSHYKTSISLSGFSNLPQTKVFYPTAAWTCLVSPFLIPRIPQKLNLFYIHLNHYQDLLEILNMYDIELPKEFTPLANRVEVLARLLGFFKRNTKLLPMYKNALQNATIMVHVDDESPLKNGGLCGDVFIPIDGEMDDDERLKCLQSFSDFCYQYVKEGKVTLDEVVWLMKFVDVQKSLTDVDVVRLIEGMKDEEKTTMVNDFWKEWDENIEKFNKIKISKNTCRPFYYVEPGVTWLDELGKILNVNKPILSVDKQFGSYVETYGQYPTKDEYILFMYRRICLGSMTSRTLPKNIRKFTDQIFARYQDIMNSLSPSEFNKRFQDNAPINERDRKSVV